MSEPEKPERPWFRFHLLMALLMMVVGSAFIGLNVRGGRMYDGLSQTHGFTYYGWPAPMFAKDDIQFCSRRDREMEIETREVIVMGKCENAILVGNRAFLIDATLLTASLISLAFISEALIRRRDMAQMER